MATEQDIETTVRALRDEKAVVASNETFTIAVFRLRKEMTDAADGVREKAQALSVNLERYARATQAHQRAMGLLVSRLEQQNINDQAKAITVQQEAETVRRRGMDLGVLKEQANG